MIKIGQKLVSDVGGSHLTGLQPQIEPKIYKKLD